MTNNLSRDQLAVIEVIKNFYNYYKLHPSMRVLIKKLQEQKNWDNAKANSLYLYELFPEGPIKQASLLGGLPPPLKCL